MDEETERKLREALGRDTRKRPSLSPLEQLRDSPLSDPKFKDWLRRRLGTSKYEVEGLLMWLAEDGQVAMSTSQNEWQEDLLVLFQEKREQEYEEAGLEGVPTTAPKRRKAPPGRSPRKDSSRLGKRPVLQKTRDRSEVVSRYVARRAARREDVKGFRREVLGGRLRASEEVDAVVSSSAYLSRRDDWDNLVENLARSYGWERGQTLRFLIAGEAPPLEPLRARVVVSGESSDAPVAVELTVSPWATFEELKAAYQAVQSDLLGGDNRPLGERALDLFRFVTSYEANPEDKPSCKELFRRWNTEHEAEDGYSYEDLRSFNRDIARVEKIARRCLAGGAGLPDTA